MTVGSGQSTINSGKLEWSLLELGKDLTQARTVYEVAKVILDVAERLFSWDAAYLNMYSEEAGAVTSILSCDTIDGVLVEIESETIVSPLSPIARSIFQDGARIFHLEGRGEEYVNHPANFGDRSRPSRTSMYAPVRTLGKQVGILSIQSYTDNAYTNDQLMVFQALADHCSGALIRTQAEEAAALLRATLDATSEAIVVLNNVGRVVDFNHTVEEILNLSSFDLGQDFLTQMSSILIDEDKFRFLYSQVREYDQESKPTTLKAKSGKVLEVFHRSQVLRGTPVGHVWSIRDITESYLAAERLERSEAIYRNAIENARGVPYRLIFGQETYDFVGEGIWELVGIEPAKAGTESIKKLVLETEILDDYPTESLTCYTKAFHAGENPQYRTDIRILHPEGDERWINDCAIPIRDDHGVIIGSLGILQDITFRKKAEIEQRKHREAQVLDLKRENEFLRERIAASYLSCPEAFEEFITADTKMRILFRYVEAIATTKEPVLIVGETGVGKELLARSVHRASGRTGSYVPVNVAGLDDHMFSDTLFGHVQGAFTGATRNRSGLVESAKDGTLFLDEIGDLEMKSQVKLLRLLQENEYYPVGSDTQRKAKTRFLFATNRNLRDMVKAGEFRKDLYFRLQTHVIEIPPLRERPDDISLLVDHFVERASKKLDKKPPTMPKSIYPLLKNYAFPGNVRELESIIFDAVSKHVSKVMSLDAIKERIHQGIVEEVKSGEFDTLFPETTLLPSLKDAQRALIREALKRADGNQSIAARTLGVTQQALNQRIQRDPTLTRLIEK